MKKQYIFPTTTYEFAIKNNLKYYFINNKLDCGHISPKTTSNNRCAKCRYPKHYDVLLDVHTIIDNCLSHNLPVPLSIHSFSIRHQQKNTRVDKIITTINEYATKLSINATSPEEWLNESSKSPYLFSFQCILDGHLYIGDNSGKGYKTKKSMINSLHNFVSKTKNAYFLGQHECIVPFKEYDKDIFKKASLSYRLAIS